MKALFSTLLFSLLFITLSFAECDDPNNPCSLETHSDSDFRMRLVWNNDPSTTMNIQFEGDSDWTSHTLYYKKHSSSVYIRMNPSRTKDVNLGTAGMYNVFFRLSGLEPDTRYDFFLEGYDYDNYIVTDDHDYYRSKVYYFETMPNDPSKKISLIFGGDSRVTTSDEVNARDAANRLVAKLRAHAVVFGGDYTLADTFGEWKNWFDSWANNTIAADGRVTPIIPAKGNHEYEKDVLQDMLDMPDEEYYYALNMGGNLLRLYTLNNGNDSHTAVTGTQTNWLANDISTNCATWKVAQYHKPMRPHKADKDERNDERAYWAPEFEDHKLQLVVESDAHLFKYTKPIASKDCASNPNCEEGFYPDTDNGVVYIGEGGWGADLRSADDAKSWTAASGSFNQFKWLWIDQGKIEIRTVKTYLPDTDTDLSTAATALTNTNRFTVPSGLTVHNTGLNINQSTYSIVNDVYTLKNYNTVNLPQVTLAPDNKIALDGSAKTLDAGAGFMTYKWSNNSTGQTLTTNTTGMYNVTCTAWSGCTTTGTVEVIPISLPVELLSFEGKAQEGGNYLTWSTASEKNTSHFIIEISEDGNRFQRIGKIAAVGNSTELQKYDFTDYQVRTTNTYYRLKIVDEDGSYEYSRIILIDNSSIADWSIKIVPVPATVSIDVTLGKAYQGMNVKYIIVNSNGKEVAQGNWSAEQNKLTLDISHFQRGVYYFSLKDTRGIDRVQRFIKL